MIRAILALLGVVACGPADVGPKVVATSGPCAAASVDFAEVLPPLPGARQVFYTDDYPGAPHEQIRAAGQAASPGGAVVFGNTAGARILELTAWAEIQEHVLYTGGGVRRACSPDTTLTVDAAAGDVCITVGDTTGWTDRSQLRLVDPAIIATGPHTAATLAQFTVRDIYPATNQLCMRNQTLPVAVTAGAIATRVFDLLRPPLGLQFSQGIGLENVTIDGGWLDSSGGSCNVTLHDWQYNIALNLKHEPSTFDTDNNWLRNVRVVNSPSESVLACGILAESVHFEQLAGSAYHLSCLSSHKHPSLLRDQTVIGAGQIPQSLIVHSKACVVEFSAFGGGVLATDLAVRDCPITKHVFSKSSADDQPLGVFGACLDDAPGPLYEVYADGDESQFRLSDLEVYP